MQTMGDIHHRLSRGKKEVIQRNLANVRRNIPRGGIKSICAVRVYFRNHYIDHLLILLFPRFGAKEVKQFINIEGMEYLDEALKLGKGVILVHGHFGPAHLPLVALARLGYRMKQIGLPSDEGLSWIGKNVAFRLRMKYESMIPAEIIKADSSMRGAFRWLNDNGIIMTTGDGSGTDRLLGKHEVLSLFGHQMMFPLGPALMSKKTGAAIIPMFITPGDNGHLYKIVIESPLVSDKSGSEAILDVTEQFVRRLETYISIYPGYMHFLDRFFPGGVILEDQCP